MFALLIPTGSDHQRNRLPIAVLSLVVINVVVDLLTNLGNHEAIAKSFGFVAAHPQWYQVFTHMFLHAGWPNSPDAQWPDYANCLLHIIGNMIYLWFAGSDLEDVLGPIKFLALYLAGGIASALLFWFTAVIGHFPNLDEPAVGASGAISALLGFYIVRFPRFKIRLWFGAMIPIPIIFRHGVVRISSLAFIGFWIGIQLLLGFQALSSGGSQVAYWGHIGGFLLGASVALATRQWRHGGLEYLLGEADHKLYQQRWYPAMQAYQLVVSRYPRCAEAITKWALCWECNGMPARGVKVLQEALINYEEKGWETEAAVIREELAAHSSILPSVPITQPTQPATHPNLMFRRDLKWKGKTS